MTLDYATLELLRQSHPAVSYTHLDVYKRQVLKQNAEDGGSRRFVLVEMDDGIARKVTAERIRRAATGYTNAKGQAVDGLGCLLYTSRCV